MSEYTLGFKAKKQQDIPAALILCRLVGDEATCLPFHLPITV